MSPLPRPLVALGRTLAARLPAPAANFIKERYRRHLLRGALRAEALNDPAVMRRWGVDAVPPPDMRLRVHGASDLESFLAMGQSNYQALIEGLQRAGRGVTSDSKVLDFGCGPGRTLRWWAAHPARPKLYGTDIDAETLDWAGNNLPVEAHRNGPLPPLPFGDGFFDVIYSISVFTHLDEQYQDAWLTELKRVLKRDGVALLTVRSDLDNARLPLALQQQVRQRGIVFHVDGLSEQFFPEFYQSTYHSAGYIERHWGALFKILGRIPMGYVDLLVMTRR